MIAIFKKILEMKTQIIDLLNNYMLTTNNLRQQLSNSVDKSKFCSLERTRDFSIRDLQRTAITGSIITRKTTD